MIDVTIGIAMDSDGGIGLAVDADGLIKVAHTAAAQVAGAAALLPMLAAVRSTCSSAASITLAVGCGDEGSLGDEPGRAAVEELGWMGIAVDQVDYLQISTVCDAVRKECTGAVPSGAPLAHTLFAFAHCRGVTGHLTSAQVMAVAVARPPVAVWREDAIVRHTGHGDHEQDRAEQDIPRARELLSVRDIMVLYGLSRSSTYDLQRRIPHYRVAGVRFRRVEVEAYIESLRVDPVAPWSPPQVQLGMPIARGADDHEEVLPGLTRGELKRKAGF